MLEVFQKLVTLFSHNWVESSEWIKSSGIWGQEKIGAGSLVALSFDYFLDVSEQTLVSNQVISLIVIVIDGFNSLSGNKS